MDVSSLHSILPEGEAPAWVQLVPGGTFSGVDGRGPYHLPDAHAVIAASLTPGNKLVFDQDHGTDHALKTGQPAPARGWITELQARDGAIWGRVDWTAAGRALIDSREYRGVSPVFAHDTKGNVTRVLRASLTNAPNLDLPSLHHKDPASMDLAAQLRAALGLPDTADAPAIVAAVTAQKATIATHATQLGAIATAAGAQAGATADAIVSAVQARGTAAPEVITALQAQVSRLTQDAARTVATAAIDKAITAGKPIPPASREDFIARHMADPQGFGAFVDALPSLNAGGLDQRIVVPAADGRAALTTDSAKLTVLMGQDPAAWAKHRADMVARGVLAA